MIMYVVYDCVYVSSNCRKHAACTSYNTMYTHPMHATPTQHPPTGNRGGVDQRRYVTLFAKATHTPHPTSDTTRHTTSHHRSTNGGDTTGGGVMAAAWSDMKRPLGLLVTLAGAMWLGMDATVVAGVCLCCVCMCCVWCLYRVCMCLCFCVCVCLCLYWVCMCFASDACSFHYAHTHPYVHTFTIHPHRQSCVACIHSHWHALGVLLRITSTQPTTTCTNSKHPFVLHTTIIITTTRQWWWWWYWGAMEATVVVSTCGCIGV